MSFYYKTKITLKFNKKIHNKSKFVCTRTETVTATGNTAGEAESDALARSAFYTTNPNEKIVFEVETIKISSICLCAYCKSL